jgi:hypothetical protein
MSLPARVLHLKPKRVRSISKRLTRFCRYGLNASPLDPLALRRVDPAGDQDGGVAVDVDDDRGGTLLHLRLQEEVVSGQLSVASEGMVG